MKKGKGNPNPVSRAGKPNKATSAAREAIAMFVDNNAHRLEGWLDEVAQQNPEKAFQLFQSVVEYHVPKLARTEQTLTGADGGPVEHSVQIKFGE